MNAPSSNTLLAETGLFSSLYLGPIAYYKALNECQSAIIDGHDYYQKQSYRNRCHIAGANGLMTLTIPIEKPQSRHTPMRDIRIAEHGNWRHIHWMAIVSAYQSTSFFMYYQDEIAPLYAQPGGFLFDFNQRWHTILCRLLRIDTPCVPSSTYLLPSAIETSPRITDFRETFHPKLSECHTPKPYYQVFAQKNGFIAHLSVIDLLCNMGNEAKLWL